MSSGSQPSPLTPSSTLLPTSPRPSTRHITSATPIPPLPPLPSLRRSTPSFPSYCLYANQVQQDTGFNFSSLCIPQGVAGQLFVTLCVCLCRTASEPSAAACSQSSFVHQLSRKN
ncbi:hypothetical protein E2C01_065627 [Portunus trituberculatus]|uniref:Uncharacterized protein n=1 Tax=Portunus trituberculatus TaxID=210409 RepID=A0A5B7HG26_PORTR|nr:hypothetical protein [Portunus trituberculatus]